jgi:hypothetical protein
VAVFANEEFDPDRDMNGWSSTLAAEGDRRLMYAPKAVASRAQPTATNT